MTNKTVPVEPTEEAPEPDDRITRTRSDGSRYVELTDAVAKQKADGRWDQIKGVQLSNEPDGELARLEARVEELEQQVCDECSPDDYGWNYNAVEGRVPCVCITESGAYQELLARVKEQEKDDE
jgi:hypothetical protein